MSKIGVVGAGLVGRAWAIVFARAGLEVALWDGVAGAVPAAMNTIRERLDDLARIGLIDDAREAGARIRPMATLREALAGASYAQESLPETLEVKRAIFAEMDAATPADAVLASSTSAIPASAFTETLKGRGRCLVAHPVNPPYLIPVVELCGTPWTEPAALSSARDLMARVGQVPVTVKREIDGFILNRLQAALLNEAFRLVEDGYVTPEDLDKTVAHGLGLRWSFMGPFETIDLNAPGGLRDYCDRYNEMFYGMAKQQADPRRWTPALANKLEAERAKVLSRDRIAERQAWRDRRLMALAAHKRTMQQTDEE